MRTNEIQPLTSEQHDKLGPNHPYFKILDETLKREYTYDAIVAYRAIRGRPGLLLELIAKARRLAGLTINGE